MTLDGNMTAYITFNGSTQKLVASLVLHDHPSQGPIEVSAQLLQYPITSLLPPEVSVGFSAASTLYKELNQILSWSFE